jgi:hypothetical protein
VLAVLTAGMLAAAAASIRLLSVSAQGHAVVIEATEPVAYTVSRPDPLTLLVDLREASIADATTRVQPQGIVSGVRLEQASAPDGVGVARVRIALGRAAEYTVKSSRNTIRVELSTTGAAQAPGAVPTPTPAALPTPPPAPRPVAASNPPPKREAAPAAATASVPDAVADASGATTIERVRATRKGASTVVTISGDGKLTPTGVTESRELPRRLILDFPNVATRAAAQTQGDGDLVHRVRVALNNNAPLVTRVVMEISDGATYTVQKGAPSDRDLTIVFNPPRVAGTAGRSARPQDDAFAALGVETITLAQAIANGAPLAPKDPVGGLDALNALKPAPPQNSATSQAQQPPAAPPAPAPQPPAPLTSPALRGQVQSQQITSGGEKKYVGHPISMDFQGSQGSPARTA